ncbi:hypothetical protein [Liquorilactobacillus hordei]|uniref:hypothetical protein n=3 Tax=Liquorilactobacillus hordei TaxID=468911 RepID=UPI001CBFD5CC|nr:hypothetical protein [Liquorilactobacillus hordei]MBZ2406442.1 hypothetical protein [Liquorilactobacillus hordei]
MVKFFEENIVAIFTACIAFFSFIIATISLFLTKNNSHLNSYSFRGKFSVYLKQNSKFKKFFTSSSFEVKIYNSIMSDTIPFEYTLQIVSMLGGIFRIHCFDCMDDISTLGVVKSLPIIKQKVKKNRFSKRYAYDNLISFSSDYFYSYFEALGKYNKEKNLRENKLNRYHNYIEITDFCGNTEIWYFSFSLYLSNLEKDLEYGLWKTCYDSSAHFKYYRFSDFTIISPNDVAMNLNRVLNYEKDLSDIRGGKEDFRESKKLIDKGYKKMEYDLQLYELKKYHEFLQKLGECKYI